MEGKCLIEGTCLAVWWLGKIVLVFCLLCIIGAIFYWVRVDRKGTLFQIKSWTNMEIHNLILTYLHLVSSYMISILSVMYVLSMPSLMEVISVHPFEVGLSAIGALSILTSMLEFTPYVPANNIVKNFTWLLHSLASSIPLAYFGPYICTISMLSTVFVLGLATIISYLAEGNLYKEYDGELTKLYYIIFISTVISLLLEHITTFFSIVMLTTNVFGGILLYFGVFIVNTQYVLSDVRTNDNYDPIYTAAVMHLCTVNLYIRVALYNLVQQTIA